MAIPSFQKSADRDALYFLSAAAGPASENYSIAFLPDNTLSADTLTLTDTWLEFTGVYLFLNNHKTEISQSELAAALRRMLDEPAFSQVRFVWVDNPGAALNRWRFHHLAVLPSADRRTSFSQVRRRTSFDWRNYALTITAGSRCRLNQAADGFVFDQAETDQAGFYLSTNYGADRLQGIGNTILLPLSGEYAGCLRFDLTLRRPRGIGQDYTELSALGAGLRTFCREPAQPASATDFYVASRQYPLLAGTAEWVSRYTADIELRATLDPLNPLQASRSFFNFTDSTAAMPSCYRTHLGYSVYLTAQADTSRLVFAEMPASSVEESAAPLYLTPSGEFVMSVPRHEPNASPSPADYDDNLICGLSGVEYIKLAPGRSNLLQFKPGQPAFAPGFIPVSQMTEHLLARVSTLAGGALTDLQPEHDLKSDLSITDVARKEDILEPLRQEYFPTGYQFAENVRDELILPDTLTLAELVRGLQQALRTSAIGQPGNTPGAALTTFATTSWAYVHQSGQSSAVYYAQPDQSVLYKASDRRDNNDDPNDDLLRYMEVPATALPDADAESAFPLFPYGGVRDALADYRELERQLLSPLRRARISAISAARKLPLPAAQTDNRLTGTTPQGLLATFSRDYETLQTLLLAKDTDGKDLGFADIEHGSPLRESLQTNQLFMVVSDAQALKQYFNNNQLAIQDWLFDLDPTHWRDNTILIFKFFDKPLLELVEDTNTWSNADAFNRNRDDTRRRLSSLIQDALLRDSPGAAAKDRQNYRSLARAARLREWSGIIALNVDVPPNNFPAALLALTAGIEHDRFYAQYIGIETTPVTAQNGQLVAGQSSLFGLIDYRDDAAPLPSDSGYNFQVNSLRVLFQNSQVKDFSAEISVTLDRLFDEPTQLRDSPNGRNIVILKGSAENHNGEVTYAFNFSGSNHFGLPDSTVLQEVDIVKAQFSTDPLANPDDPAASISGRFAFWGHLNFKLQEKFDAFSFGAENTDEEENDQFLRFGNLTVTMTFQLNQPEEREFAFDPRNLVFDLKRSKVRAESLFAKFPLKLTALNYSHGEKSTDAFGYMPVKSPLGGAKLAPVWYGMVFDLELGSVGALAGKAGLVVQLIAAWSPSLQNVGASDESGGGPKGGGMFVGLRLPGSTGGKREITIQGVVKIAFKSIEFTVWKSPDERTSYLLKLKNIVLKFFVLSLPPNARSEIIIFGNPDGTAEDRTLGWYAAYAKGRVQ